MGDPFSIGLSIGQIIQGFVQGLIQAKDLKALRSDVAGIRIDLNKLSNAVQSRLPANATVSQIIETTTTVLTTTPLEALFVAGPAETIVRQTSPDMPPSTDGNIILIS